MCKKAIYNICAKRAYVTFVQKGVCYFCARRAYVDLANNSLDFHPHNVKYRYVIAQKELYLFCMKSKMQIFIDFR